MNKDDQIQEHYLSEEYGYMPQEQQTRVTCPKCGNGVFDSPAQTVVLNAPVWCHEYVCRNCGWTVGIEVNKGLEDKENDVDGYE